jgi:integrase
VAHLRKKETLMLKTVRYRKLEECSSLMVLGPIVHGFVAWLLERGHTPGTIKRMLRMVRYLEGILIKRGVRRVRDIRQADIAACRTIWKKRMCQRSRMVMPGALEEYLVTSSYVRRGWELENQQGSRSPYLVSYAHYLKTVRGLAAGTIRSHLSKASGFIAFLGASQNSERFKNLTTADTECFIKSASRTQGRRTLRTTVLVLRRFLQFMASEGKAPKGLDQQLDHPCVYQQEELPRCLPWSTVRQFLKSIDRSTQRGRRDFTMLLLIAT